jgi:hypothetical protein
LVDLSIRKFFLTAERAECGEVNGTRVSDETFAFSASLLVCGSKKYFVGTEEGAEVGE